MISLLLFYLLLSHARNVYSFEFSSLVVVTGSHIMVQQPVATATLAAAPTTLAARTIPSSYNKAREKVGEHQI